MKYDFCRHFLTFSLPKLLLEHEIISMNLNNFICYLLDLQTKFRIRCKNKMGKPKTLLLISLFFFFLFIIGLYLSSLYEVSWIS